MLNPVERAEQDFVPHCVSVIARTTHVRGFDEPYGPLVRQRIAGIYLLHLCGR